MATVVLATIALTGFIRKAVDVAGDLVVDEGSRWYWLQEDLKWITRELTLIRAYLSGVDAMIASQGESDGLSGFINGINELAYDAQKVIDLYTFKIKRKGVPWFSMTSVREKHKLGREIQKIKRRIEIIHRARKTYGIPDSTSIVHRDRRRSYPHVKEPNVVGLEEQIQKLVGRLLNATLKNCVVSIVGMPGLGKTTLARKVYNSVKNQFECCAWVYVSQNPSQSELLKDIARQVGLEDRQEESLSANLYALLEGKKYVIFLDDIWETKIWDDLKVSIPENSVNGKRILLTARDATVGRYIGGESSLHEMKPLDTQNSWELFSAAILGDAEDTNEMDIAQELEVVGRSIVGKCLGVPIAIKAAAGMLRGKMRTLDMWRRVLRSMDQKEELLDILALSYKYLPLHLKHCFLYLEIFPKGQKIAAFQIINLWVAEGFVPRDVNDIQVLEDIAQDYLEELIARNLVTVHSRRVDGRIKKCYIHDLMHNLCISEARKSTFFSTSNNIISAAVRPVDDVLADCRISDRRIFLSVTEDEAQQKKLRGKKDREEYVKLSEREQRKYLKKYIENFLKKYLKTIAQKFKHLTVIWLESSTLPPSLPDEIFKLGFLTYLRLTGEGHLEVPHSISKLLSLETLDFQECSNVTLPAVIWKMTRLRHILLPLSAKFKHGPMSKLQAVEEVSLPNLQNLYTMNCYYLKTECLREFTNLVKLGISCSMEQATGVLTDSPPISATMEILNLQIRESSPHITQETFLSDNNLIPENVTYASRQLNFSGYCNLVNLYLEGPVVKLPVLPTSLNKLTMAGTRLDQDPMEELGKLVNLKKLQLRTSSYMGSSMLISGDSNFPRLEEFILEPLPSVKELKAEGEVMPRLKSGRINSEIMLHIHSERLKDIFGKSNDYIMRMNYLLTEVKFTLPDDDFIWEEEEEEGGGDSVLLPTNIANIPSTCPSTESRKGKEIVHEEESGNEIVETQYRTFELGECSSTTVTGSQE